MRINNLVIIGVGLIGGSLAKALRANNAVDKITGIDRAPNNLRRAMESGVIDDAFAPSKMDQLEVAIREADVVFLAVPIGQTGTVLKKIHPFLRSHTIITDSGSAKEAVVRIAREYLGSKFSRFVPGHPIAGAEQSGFAASTKDLFENKHVVLTPVKESNAIAVSTIEGMWECCGAEVYKTEPHRHDEIFASVSHLPHVLAFVFVDFIAKKQNAKELFNGAGSGFRDFTRISGSLPKMWRDISLDNRDALIKELAAFQTQLSRMLELLIHQDGKGIEAIFSEAREARKKWMLNQRDIKRANYEL